MATFLNVGRMDRSFRVALGIGLAFAGILAHGHRYLGWVLGITGASLILSGFIEEFWSPRRSARHEPRPHAPDAQR